MNRFLFLIFLCLSLHNCRSDELSRKATIKFDDIPASDDRAERVSRKYDAKPEVSDGRYGTVADRHTYDLFMPSPWKEEDLPPLIVFAHPGAFIMGDKSDYMMQKMCKDFARMGYATASINYNLINITSENVSLSGRKTSIMKAVSDARQAIKYIQRTHGFQPEQTVFVGYSAGAIIGNHLVFSDINEVIRYLNGASNFNTEHFDLPSPGLLAGVVAISGAVLDFGHVTDSDLTDQKLFLIHGTKDGIVPYAHGKPFRRFVEQDLELKLPGIYYELGGSYQGNDFIFRFGQGFEIPSYLLELSRNAVFPDALCGSACIAEDLGHKPNLSILTVEGGPHSFMHNSQEGDLNKTYFQVQRRIKSFVKKCISSRERDREADSSNSRNADRRRRSNRY